MNWEKILKSENDEEGLQEYIEANFDRRKGFEGRWWAKYQNAGDDEQAIVNALFRLYKTMDEGDVRATAKVMKAMKSVIKFVMEDIVDEDEPQYLVEDVRGEAEQERAGERADDARRELQAERETEDRGFY